jgi:peroxiredoxin
VSTHYVVDRQETIGHRYLKLMLLSDQHLRFTRKPSLPTFVAAGFTLLKGLTVIVNNGRIEWVIHPMFPLNRNAADTLTLPRAHRKTSQ